MSDLIEQTARVLSTLTTCDGHPNATELHRRQAQALADAGLLAQPTPTSAEAWDEGKRAGLRQSDWEHGDTATQYIATNPYRHEHT